MGTGCLFQFTYREYTPMKHFKISCQKHKIGSLNLLSRSMTNYMKTCLFLHVHFTETMKMIENLSRKSLW